MIEITYRTFPEVGTQKSEAQINHLQEQLLGVGLNHVMLYDPAHPLTQLFDAQMVILKKGMYVTDPGFKERPVIELIDELIHPDFITFCQEYLGEKVSEVEGAVGRVIYDGSLHAARFSLNKRIPPESQFEILSAYCGKFGTMKEGRNDEMGRRVWRLDLDGVNSF